MTTYTVSQRAYAKIAFHVAKYPHRPVNGVLLGKDVSGNIEFIDAIPLLHHWTSLSPSMEIGLDLARNHALSLDLQVAGYYQATENLDDTALAPVGEKVAETIKRTFPQAVAFVVDGSRLAAGEPALVPYLPQGNSSSWRPAARNEDVQPFSATSHFKLAPPSASTHVLELIRDSKMHQKLGDFDDHLEDVSIDWLRNSDCNGET
ncbi:hypothetical protein DFH11DRAFT_1857281 [Phellopilus nigrolimitatus]|nr:hypothetical protein DFH11DRAFT_1857281 [Phellopilus nigrolimitatus]